MTNELTLSDVDHVKQLRALARTDAWASKAPLEVQSQLVLPLGKIKVLEGTLDDLLAAIEESLVTLAHPINANLARTMTALDHVNLSLDIALDDYHDADRVRGARLRRQPATIASSGGEARGRAISEAAAVHDADIKKCFRAWKMSEEGLQEEYPKFISYAQEITGLPLWKLRSRIKFLNLET